MNDQLLLKFFGLISVSLSLVIVGTILNAWALTYAWGVFVVPKFGLPVLNLPEAVILSSIVSFLTYQYVPSTKSSISTFIEVLSFLLVKPVLFLMIVHITSYFL